MADIYRHDINLTNKQSITMFSKRSTPYNKAELARLLYMQGYKDQTTGLRVNTSSGSVVLYNTTGNNTDGAMTQKATTEELAKKLDTAKGVTIDTEQTITGTKTIESLNLHGEILGTGQYEEGNITTTANAFGSTSTPSMIKSIYRPQVELPNKKELLAYISDIPNITAEFVYITTNAKWWGYKFTINNKFVILFGTAEATSTGSKTFNFGFSFKEIPFLSTGYTGATGKLGDGVGLGDIANRSISKTSFTYNQRYSNRGVINFIAVGEI